MEPDNLDGDGLRAPREAWFERFEAIGEQIVRDALTNRSMGGRKAVWAQRWLRSLDDARAVATSMRRDEISEETLLEVRKANDIAERALANARTATTIATMAMISAVVAIAVSIITAFVSN